MIKNYCAVVGYRVVGFIVDGFIIATEFACHISEECLWRFENLSNRIYNAIHKLSK